MGSTIVLATNGDAGSQGAIRWARALALREHLNVEVLAVDDLPHRYGAGVAELAAAYTDDYERHLEEGIRRCVRERLADTLGGEPADWPLTIRAGMPARVLREFVAERQAGLVLVGIGRHDWLERVFGRETALDIIDVVPIPVLAVHPAAAELPQRAVAACDFSAISEHAVQQVVRLLGPGAALDLVHVAPTHDALYGEMDADERAATYAVGARERLFELRNELEAQYPLQVRTQLLEGEPATAILEHAGRVGAELIAAGTHGHGLLGRVLLGSVSRVLIRRAAVSVLVVPPGPRLRRAQPVSVTARAAS
jgi:nucleotide-binding universal stress UspA family protein